MKKIKEVVKKIIEIIKELKKTPKGRAILFFGFYFIFFLTLAISSTTSMPSITWPKTV